MSDNYFVDLNKINVQDKVEKKNNLTYLSWAWAWGELKKRHPKANYTIYEDKDGMFYHTDGNTCWVKTGVTVDGIEHIEYLPVMDYRNKSIALDKVTSFDVNKAIQRSLTKAVARHGLGLYIYAGEDLPEESEIETKEEIEKQKKQGKELDDKVKIKAREELLKLLSEKNIDIVKYGKEHKLNKDSTASDYYNLIKSLNKGK